MNIETSAVKARIRRWRNNSGVSIGELARVGGVSESTIRRYDDPSDPREPSLIVIGKLCAHYGISMDWLVFGSTANIEADVRFRMLLDNLSARLPPEAQLGFAEFIQAIYDMALKLGRDGAPLVELQER